MTGLQCGEEVMTKC